MLRQHTSAHPMLDRSLPFSGMRSARAKTFSRARRVLLLDSGNLLHDLVPRLLRDQPDLGISIARMTEEEAVACEIAAGRHQTVILTQSERFSVDRLHQILAELGYQDEVRILSVSMTDGFLEVYCCRKLVLRNFREFIDLVKNGSQAPH